MPCHFRPIARWTATFGLLPLPLLALLLALPASARGGAITASGATDAHQFTFETSGSIGTDGVTGQPLLSFAPNQGTATGASDFDLGAFVVQAGPGDPVTHYDRTPFTIRFWTRSVDGASTAGADGAGPAPLTIGGWITGDAGGPGRSALTIQFDQGIQPDDPAYYATHPLPPIPAGSALGGSMGLAPGGYLTLNEGRDTTTVDGQGMVESPVLASVAFAPNVPEPSSILVMGGLGLAGLVARWRTTRRP